jgi:1-acyl-sn-glycerol-3-phosphate acyltransferase
METATDTVLYPGANFWPTTYGWENVKEAERVHACLCFNHVSYMDAAVLAATIAPCGVAKASLCMIGCVCLVLECFFPPLQDRMLVPVQADVATLPLVGPICRAMQFLFIERRGTTGGVFVVQGHVRVNLSRIGLHQDCSWLVLQM